MIISKTPLRASFFGGGTDFKEYYENNSYGYGAVISTALNMYVYIMVCKRFDNKIRVCYTKNEFVDSVVCLSSHNRNKKFVSTYYHVQTYMNLI